MATPSPAQPDAEVLDKNQRAERQASAIAAFVMKALGHPHDFRRGTVARLWGNRFRVNVHTGGAMSTRVAHSFFLAADENGVVTESDPAITRLYEAAAPRGHHSTRVTTGARAARLAGFSPCGWNCRQ